MSDHITLEQAQRAIAAAFDEATKDGKNMAAAIVDANGDPICSARMDGTHERVLRFALRKAYTAAVMARDTLAFKRDMERANRTLADYGDSMFTTLQGGMVIFDQGRVVGGIAVGGNTSERDEAIARVALRALGFVNPGGVTMANERRVALLANRNADEPLAWATRIGDIAFSSTITGRDLASGQLADEPEAQFETAFDNVRRLVDAAGLTTDDIAQLTVVINDASYRQHINKPWLKLFPKDEDRPARKTNHAGLPDGELVNLHFVAVPGGRRRPLGIDGLAHRDPLPMGVRTGNMVFSSVLAGDDPATGKRVEGADAQIDQAFHNMLTLTEGTGGTVDDIAHVWVFMDMDHQPSMVRAWLEMFPDEGNRPARKTIAYGLGAGSVIQVQFTAVVGTRRRNFEVPGIGHHDPIPLANKQGNLLYSSGIVGTNPATGLLADDAERQAIQALENVAKVLELAGGTTGNLIQATALVADNKHRPAVMSAWREFFPSAEDQPALHILELGLPGRDTVVQVNVVAAF